MELTILLQIFGTKAPTGADIDLLLQIFLFIMILVGFRFARQKNFTIHGYKMTLVVIINTILIFAFMIPSVEKLPIGASQFVISLLLVLTPIHVFGGTITKILAIYLVLRMYAPLPSFLKIKNFRLVMQVTLVLWILMIFTGFGQYILRYVT